METMKALVWSWLVACASLCAVVSAGAQTPVGALAVDERRGDRYGWAVDYESQAAAWEAALSECGTGCSVVLTFARCGAYAADQDADSTAVGWAESYASAAGARQAALSECHSRGGGSGCIVRAWGCNGPVVEEGLGLERATRRLLQQGLSAEGFHAGVADGLFGPRTRAAIRGWQSARGLRSTGYLDGPQVEALRGQDESPQLASAGAAATDAGGVEVVFWQSIVNSTNPADFEAYLRRFPNGVFSELARNRLAALPGSTAGFRPAPTCAGQPVGAACWQEISLQPGCHVWNPARQPGSTATWTGECTGGFAQGAGTLTWAWDGNRQTTTGRMVDGKANGHAVFRFADGGIQEGPIVDGESNGHWVLRFADGGVEEGPLVDGERNGHWVIRQSDGDVEEGPFVDGERNGHWAVHFADGIVAEGPYVNGKENGNWVIRWADGDVDEWLFRDGERVR